jgi:PAS domain S-box-containing protein
MWLELDVTARRDGRDRRWYVAVANDVTARRERERTLEQYERIVETIDDGVYVLDDAFDITAVNDAVAELTGYDREELVGSNAAMLAESDTLEQAATATEALLAGDSEAATISTAARRRSVW